MRKVPTARPARFRMCEEGVRIPDSSTAGGNHLRHEQLAVSVCELRAAPTQHRWRICRDATHCARLHIGFAQHGTRWLFHGLVATQVRPSLNHELPCDGFTRRHLPTTTIAQLGQGFADVRFWGQFDIINMSCAINVSGMPNRWVGGGRVRGSQDWRKRLRLGEAHCRAWNHVSSRCMLLLTRAAVVRGWETRPLPLKARNCGMPVRSSGSPLALVTVGIDYARSKLLQAMTGPSRRKGAGKHSYKRQS